jgi:hypothetical protein
VGIPLSGSGTVALEVVDARPYVVNGSKSPDFVGLQRGGYGNPFDVKTGSGGPLAEELSAAISSAMRRQGFIVVGKSEPAPRTLQLTLLEWKTDVMLRMKVAYDLVLQVFDDEGGLLASSKAAGEEVLGGGFENQNAENATRTFEVKFSELIRHEDVQRALQDRTDSL